MYESASATLNEWRGGKNLCTPPLRRWLSYLVVAGQTYMGTRCLAYIQETEADRRVEPKLRMAACEHTRGEKRVANTDASTAISFPRAAFESSGAVEDVAAVPV